MPLPKLTEEQRQANLAKAAESRKRRHESMEALKKGDITLESVLTSEDPAVNRTPVKTVLKAMPGIGVARAQRIMAEIGIDEKRRVSGLGARQKEKLLAYFAFKDE